MMTVQQAAEKWKLSARTVQNLCASGRIDGVERRGRDWFIPDDAQRPGDRRTRAVKSAQNTVTMPMATPLLYMSSLYSAPGKAEAQIEKLSAQPALAAQFKAWMLFVQGQAEKAVELAKPLVDIEADFYASIGLGHLLCACALWLNDMPLFRIGREKIKNAPCSGEAEKTLREFWLSMADTGVMSEPHYPDWFRNGNFENVPHDSLPAVSFFYVRYIHRQVRELARGQRKLQDVQRMGLYRFFPCMLEPMVTIVQHSGSLVAEIYIRLLCADIYTGLGDADNAVRHMDAAIALALPDKLYGILAEARAFYISLMDERLSLAAPEIMGEIESMYKKVRSGWMKMSPRPLIESLSDREMEIAQLAALGLSNEEIANRLGISAHTVKSRISSVMNKTNVQKRTELSDYIF